MRRREVDVDVGRARHLLVQEALEQQVVLDRVDARDAEHVGDDRVRRGAATLPRDAMLARKAHQVPVDEEELGQARLLDHLELVLQAPGDRGGDRHVASPQALEAEFVEKRERRLAGWYGVAGEADLAEVQVEIALLRDVPWRGHRLGVPAEQRAQLGAALEVVLGVEEKMLAGFIQRGAVADGDEHVVQMPALARVIVDLVGGDHSGATAPRHRGPSLEDPLVLRTQVMVELAENVVFA